MGTEGAYGSARITAPRRAIADAVERMCGAFTAEELAGEVRSCREGAGATATVYRALSVMEANGFIECVGSRDGAALYTRCRTRHHHHHIVCERCGRTEAAACPFEPVRTAAADAGFVVTRHEVTLYGLCPECATSEER